MHCPDTVLPKNRIYSTMSCCNVVIITSYTTTPITCSDRRHTSKRAMVAFSSVPSLTQSHHIFLHHGFILACIMILSLSEGPWSPAPPRLLLRAVTLRLLRVFSICLTVKRSSETISRYLEEAQAGKFIDQTRIQNLEILMIAYIVYEALREERSACALAQEGLTRNFQFMFAC